VSMRAGYVSSLLRSPQLSRRRLHSFVFSALDFCEFKRFHDSIYPNLRELSLFFYMLTSTTLNPLGFGKRYILIAFVD